MNTLKSNEERIAELDKKVAELLKAVEILGNVVNVINDNLGNLVNGWR